MEDPGIPEQPTDQSWFRRSGWEAAGFGGFLPLLNLPASQVPDVGGVYAVLRESTAMPEFLVQSGGGWFKGRPHRDYRRVAVQLGRRHGHGLHR